MPPSRSERALRRLVADLALVRGDDIAAVLSRLEPAQRRRVEDLLGAYPGGPLSGTAAPARAQASAVPPALDGVSAWLAARLGHSPTQAIRGEGAADLDGPSLNHAMTAVALAALAQAAADVRATAPEAPPRASSAGGPAAPSRLQALLMSARGRR